MANERCAVRIPVTLVLATLGFAIFLASVWTARNEAALVPDLALYAARFVKAAGCFAIAYLFRSHIPRVRVLLALGAGLISAHVIAYAATFAIDASSPAFSAFALTDGVLSGAGEACIILIYAHLFSTYSPKHSVVAISAAYLLNEALYTAALLIPTSALLILRPAGKVAGVALLFLCLLRKERGEQADDEYPLQFGLSTKPEEGPAWRFLSSSREWTLIIACSVLFPLLFGFIAQACSTAGANSGLYDMGNEIIALMVLIVLLAFAIRTRGVRSFDTVLYCCIPLFATGCVALPALWYEGAGYAGTVVKCGYTVCQVMMWMLLARKVYEDLRRTYLYFGVFYGLFELATAAARMAVSRMYAAGVVDAQSITYLALGCLWLIAVYGLVFFALSKRSDGAAAVAPPSPGGSSDAAGLSPCAVSGNSGAEVPEADSPAPSDASEPDAAALPSVDPFVAKLALFCDSYNLSDREREVLTWAIHGYSMENIGKKLYVSRETVKTYLRRIYVKCGVGGKQELLSLVEGM